MAVCWRGLLLALCCAGNSMLMAGERNLSASVAPVCARGECRPAPHAGARVQGALLQAAALSLASGPVSSQASLNRTHERPSVAVRRGFRPGTGAPRRPSCTARVRWWRRSEIPVSRQRQARVRESSQMPATADPVRMQSPAHASTQKATAGGIRQTPSRSKDRSRVEARGTHHRRLVAESIERGLEDLTLGEQDRQPRDATMEHSTGLPGSVVNGSSSVMSVQDASFDSGSLWPSLSESYPAVVASSSAARPQPTPSFSSDPEPMETK